MPSSMHERIFPTFVDPNSLRPLEFGADRTTLNIGGKALGRLENGFYRFCTEGYTEAFGTQWNAFRKTQLDSYSNTSITRDRIGRIVGNLEILRDKDILEVGSGAGRFTEIIAPYAASLVTTDASSAIEANYANNSDRFPNTLFCQASVYELPFPDNSFNVTVALGMVQHTPDPIETLRSIVRKTKPGGLIVADFYRLRLSFLTRFGVQMMRYRMRGGDPKRNFEKVKKLVNWLYPLHSSFCRTLFGYLLISRISPIVTYFHKYPQLDEAQQREWAWLDTHDTLTDHYKYLFTVGGVGKLCSELNCSVISLQKGGNGIELLARKNG